MTNWDDLRVLLAVIESGSLSRAARALGLSQPTVGRRLDALEAALGGLLVERTARGCVPTELGAAVREHALAMRTAADGVVMAARATDGSLRGLVRVACGEMVGRLIGRRAAELLDDAPGLSVEVVSGLSMANLERGDADLALRNQPPTSGHLASRWLGRSPFAVFGARSYVAAHPEALDDRRFSACRWVGYVEGRPAPSARWLAARRGALPELRFNTSSLILEACASGVGLAVLPPYADQIDGRLVPVSEPLEDLAFESYLVTHARTRRLPRVRRVADAVSGWLGH